MGHRLQRLQHGLQNGYYSAAHPTQKPNKTTKNGTPTSVYALATATVNRLNMHPPPGPEQENVQEYPAYHSVPKYSTVWFNECKTGAYIMEQRGMQHTCDKIAHPLS